MDNANSRGLASGSMRNFAVLVGGLVTLALPRAVRATPVPCDLADAGFAIPDGAVSEWGAVDGVTVEGPGLPVPNGAWTDNKDASFTVKCVYDGEFVTFAITALDERLLRNAAPDPMKDDAITLAFADGKGGVKRLEIFPPDGQGVKLSARWMPGKKPAKSVSGGFEFGSGAVKNGYNLEVAFPYAMLPGFSKSTPRIPFGVYMSDADARVANKIEALLTTAKGRADKNPKELDMLGLQSGDEVYREFLQKLKIKPGAITIDQLVEVDGHDGPERVIRAGRIVAALSDSFTYFTIPAQTDKDVREVKLVDLTGEKRMSVLARYLQRGIDGSRELVSVWNLDGTDWVRTFSHETGKFQDQNKVINTWSMKKPAKGKGLELHFAVGEVVGWDQETWLESPAEDAVPILLPWGDGPRADAFAFQGYEYIGVDLPAPKSGKKTKKSR